MNCLDFKIQIEERFDDLALLQIDAYWRDSEQITLYPETTEIAGKEIETIRARAAIQRKPAPDNQQPTTNSDQPGETDAATITEQEAA